MRPLPGRETTSHYLQVPDLPVVLGAFAPGDLPSGTLALGVGQPAGGPAHDEPQPVPAQLPEPGRSIPGALFDAVCSRRPPIFCTTMTLHSYPDPPRRRAQPLQGISLARAGKLLVRVARETSPRACGTTWESANRLLSRLVPAGAWAGEMTWAPNSLSSSPDREWRRRTMAARARKKVRTRRRSICWSSHPSKGPRCGPAYRAVIAVPPEGHEALNSFEGVSPILTTQGLPL